MDGRLENISKALWSSLALELPDVFNKGDLFCTSNECGSVFALCEPRNCFVTEHERRRGVDPFLSWVFPELWQLQ